MRIFTMVVSAVFVAIGIWLIASSESFGWQLVAFFGLCLLISIFEPWFPKGRDYDKFELVITADEVACEHRARKRESIRWEDVNRVWYITNSDGPWFPDEWLLLEGEDGGCSFPSEATGISQVWSEFEQRYPGFDFGPIIRGGTVDARHLCWERDRHTTLGERAASSGPTVGG